MKATIGSLGHLFRYTNVEHGNCYWDISCVRRPTEWILIKKGRLVEWSLYARSLVPINSSSNDLGALTADHCFFETSNSIHRCIFRKPSITRSATSDHKPNQMQLTADGQRSTFLVWIVGQSDQLHKNDTWKPSILSESRSQEIPEDIVLWCVSWNYSLGKVAIALSSYLKNRPDLLFIR